MFHQPEHAVEIDGHRATPLLVSHAVNRRIFRRPDPVVGDENVEPPELGNCSGDQFARGFWGGKLALHGVAVCRPALAHECIGLRFGGLIVEYNLRARGGKQADGGRANAARSAGDESDLGVE